MTAFNLKLFVRTSSRGAGRTGAFVTVRNRDQFGLSIGARELYKLPAFEWVQLHYDEDAHIVALAFFVERPAIGARVIRRDRGNFAVCGGALKRQLNIKAGCYELLPLPERENTWYFKYETDGEWYCEQCNKPMAKDDKNG